jgi:hypothetical protein
MVLKLPLTELSAKVRMGPPIDDEDDYKLPIWAGVVPLRLVAGAPITDDRVPKEISAPEYAVSYSRNGNTK